MFLFLTNRDSLLDAVRGFCDEQANKDILDMFDGLDYFSSSGIIVSYKSSSASRGNAMPGALSDPLFPWEMCPAKGREEACKSLHRMLKDNAYDGIIYGIDTSPESICVIDEMRLFFHMASLPSFLFILPSLHPDDIRYAFCNMKEYGSDPYSSVSVQMRYRKQLSYLLQANMSVFAADIVKLYPVRLDFVRLLSSIRNSSSELDYHGPVYHARAYMPDGTYAVLSDTSMNPYNFLSEEAAEDMLEGSSPSMRVLSSKTVPADIKQPVPSNIISIISDMYDMHGLLPSATLSALQDLFIGGLITNPYTFGTHLLSRHRENVAESIRIMRGIEGICSSPVFEKADDIIKKLSDKASYRLLFDDTAVASEYAEAIIPTGAPTALSSLGKEQSLVFAQICRSLLFCLLPMPSVNKYITLLDAGRTRFVHICYDIKEPGYLVGAEAHPYKPTRRKTYFKGSLVNIRSYKIAASKASDTETGILSECLRYASSDRHVEEEEIEAPAESSLSFGLLPPMISSWSLSSLIEKKMAVLRDGNIRLTKAGLDYLEGLSDIGITPSLADNIDHMTRQVISETSYSKAYTSLRDILRQLDVMASGYGGAGLNM